MANDFEHVYARLYNFDFPGAHHALDVLESQHPDEPLAYVTRAAAHLFQEFDRLGILASEFFRDRGEKLLKQGLKASPDTKLRLMDNLDTARRLARKRLSADPGDSDAIFVLALASGIECDYAVFVEKQRMSALSLAKDSHRHALRVQELDADYEDARLIPGINEYMVGSLPFFVRWFVRFEEVKGDKEAGIHHLERVVRSGRYLKPFAKILLVAIHLREERYQDSRVLMAELVSEFPENLLFRRELAKLDEKLSSAKAS